MGISRWGCSTGLILLCSELNFKQVFYCSDGHYTSDTQAQGPQLVNEAFNHIQSATYWVNEDGTDNWIINNVRVSQTIDGLVR